MHHFGLSNPCNILNIFCHPKGTVIVPVAVPALACVCAANVNTNTGVKVLCVVVAVLSLIVVRNDEKKCVVPAGVI
jgi:hypothetical protein